MGVIRNNYNNIRGHYQNNGDDGNDDWIYVSSESEEILDTEDDQRQSLNSRAINIARPKSKNKPEPTFSGLGAKGKSHRKFRRYANANLINDLGNLINENELDDELSIEDFIPTSSSPSSFTLLMNSCKNKLLNEFINCTEDEQTILLDRVIEYELDQYRRNHCRVMDREKQDETEIEKLVEDSDLCFARISPAIRKQLLKKRVPLGILASIEQKVLGHFRVSPKTIYKTSLQCSYQRFLLHACCQYLNLNCRSSNTNGKRLSCVHNERVIFVEPSKLLSEHLDFNKKL